MSTQEAINIHLGARIRKARKELAVSQSKLAEALGVTFQQVQKFENGRNRIAASQMFVVASRLECDLNYFFAGLPKSTTAKASGRWRRAVA